MPRTGTHSSKQAQLCNSPHRACVTAENARAAHRKHLGAFCRHSRRVDNKTLRNNALPTYPQVINTLFARFSTANTGQRSLVCRATKPSVECKQDFFALQTRLLCARRLEKPSKPPLRSAEKGWERAVAGSRLQVGAVKVFYFFSRVLQNPQAAGNIVNETLKTYLTNPYLHDYKSILVRLVKFVVKQISIMRFLSTTNFTNLTNNGLRNN